MKKKSVRIFSWVASITALLFLAYFLMLDLAITGGTSIDYATARGITTPTSTPENDTAFGGIFMNDFSIDKSLPHYIYQQKADSIKTIKDNLDWQNKSIAGSGGRVSFIGYATIEKIPFPGKKVVHSPAPKTDSVNYYLTLPGYSLDYDNKFFVADDRYYLAVVEWEPQHKSGREGRYIRKQIPVRYAAESKEIMIPIKKGQYKTVAILFRVGFLLIILAWVYTIIGLPIQLLINISRGKAFTLKNISILRFIAFMVFGMSMINILAPYLLRLLLHNNVPAEFHREPFLNVLVNNFNAFLLSIVAFIVSIAFKKGYNLQQEQELTV